MTGLRAELAVRGTDACPVAAVSESTDGPVRDVTWTSGQRTVERFTLAESDPTVVTESAADESASGETTADESERTAATDAASESEPTTATDAASKPTPTIRLVYTDETGSVVEFDRDWNGCVCELIEATGCPVESVEARDGTLTLTVHARSRERLRRVIAAAREAADRVSLNYVVTGGETTTADPVVVDRGRLTDRQREVVTTAYEAGYFEHPREANAETVASRLGVSSATFREHLATAQRKLLGAIVE